jgi:hypothetical protein
VNSDPQIFIMHKKKVKAAEHRGQDEQEAPGPSQPSGDGDGNGDDEDSAPHIEPKEPEGSSLASKDAGAGPQAEALVERIAGQMAGLGRLTSDDTLTRNAGVYGGAW